MYEDVWPREKHFLMSRNPLNSTRSTMRNEYLLTKKVLRQSTALRAGLYGDRESSAALYYAISDVNMTKRWWIDRWRKSPESSFHDRWEIKYNYCNNVSVWVHQNLSIPKPSGTQKGWKKNTTQVKVNNKENYKGGSKTELWPRVQGPVRDQNLWRALTQSLSHHKDLCNSNCLSSFPSTALETKMRLLWMPLLYNIRIPTSDSPLYFIFP